MEVKNFVGGKTQPKKEEMRDMTWIEYIKIHLHNLYYKYQAPWIPQFLNFLNNKNINISEKKYCSNAFYYEYQLLTLSQTIIPEIEKFQKYQIIFINLLNKKEKPNQNIILLEQNLIKSI